MPHRFARRRRSRVLPLFALGFVGILGCSSGSGSTPAMSGGAVGQGSGGKMGSGGSSAASGGGSGSGGATGSGGRTGSGGATASGGATGTGGRAASGGTSGAASGGAPASGGTPGSGGAPATGGATPGTGGTAGKGGPGGATASGGATGTGGAACTPSCGSKTCGSDGCNGTCGGCPPTQLCGSNGTCQAPAGTGVTIDAHAQLTPISPDIYGVAFATEAGDDSYKVSTLDRWGGDAEESYNWQKDMNNAGGDWNCANYVGSGNGTDTFVQTNMQHGLNSLITIPITGWLANVATTSDTTYSAALGQPLSFCNYPQLSDGSLLPSAMCCSAIGAQESVLVDKGSSALDTSFMGNWLAHFVSTFGTASAGGVKYYQLDNEPDNWQGLRQDIYPSFYPPGTNCMDYAVKIASGTQAGVTPNDDLMNRSVAYAATIKKADPTATVLFLSVMNPDDMINLMRTECGVGTWGTSQTVPYSIDKSYAMAMMAKGKQYEDTNHQRIFDCLDTHYPGAAQEMWTNTFSRFQGWIDTTYPGTGICVSEYNVANDTSDATVTAKQADYLGTFGAMGVRLASYWTTLAPKDANQNHVHSYAYNAFAMFRNYDGAGATFGSVSVGAASSYAGLHAYAATDAAANPTKLWVMLVNTGTAAQSGVTITVSNFTASGSAQVYQSTNGAAPAAGTAAAISAGKISGLTIAPNAVTLLVLSR